MKGWLNKQIDNDKTERSRLNAKNEKNQKIELCLAYANRIYENMNLLYKTEEVKVRERLQAAINEIFKNIYNGGLHIEINDKYRISVIDDRYNTPVESSDGQSISVVFSFIAAIIKLARENGESEDEGMRLSELIDIATIGLMNALYNYDPLDRRPINTYICFYIYREFIRNGDCPRPLIYYPAHIKDAYTSLLPKLVKEFGRNLEYFTSDDVEELKEWIKENMPKDVSDNEYEQIVVLCLAPDISLDEMLEQSSGDDNILNQVVLIDDIINEKDPAYYAMVSDTRNVIANICSKLKEKEREILYLRHGFIDGREYTLQECGERFNLTRERIRQIENKAYKKLRLYLMNMKIEPFMLDT